MQYIHQAYVKVKIKIIGQDDLQDERWITSQGLIILF